MFTDEKISKIKEELKTYNASIDRDKVQYIFGSAAYLTNLDDRIFWKDKLNTDRVENVLYRCGCLRILDEGIAIGSQAANSVFDWSKDGGCNWMVALPNSLKTFTELRESRKEISIFDLATKLDFANNAVLIRDDSNEGRYFWIPKKDGITIEEACPVVTPLKKCELPKCSLKKICGDNLRVKDATPKEVSEEVLIPLIDRVIGPFPNDLWQRIKDYVKMEKVDVREYEKSLRGETKEGKAYSI